MLQSTSPNNNLHDNACDQFTHRSETKVCTSFFERLLKFGLRNFSLKFCGSELPTSTIELPLVVTSEPKRQPLAFHTSRPRPLPLYADSLSSLSFLLSPPTRHYPFFVPLRWLLHHVTALLGLQSAVDVTQSAVDACHVYTKISWLVLEDGAAHYDNWL